MSWIRITIDEGIKHRRRTTSLCYILHHDNMFRINLLIFKPYYKIRKKNSVHNCTFTPIYVSVPNLF